MSKIDEIYDKYKKWISKKPKEFDKCELRDKDSILGGLSIRLDYDSFGFYLSDCNNNIIEIDETSAEKLLRYLQDMLC